MLYMRTTENKETGEKMHVYEIGYLVVPTLSEGKVSDEVASIHSVLEKAGATIISEDFPKLSPLAYVMERSTESKKQKFNEGYFGWIKFELPVVSISDITKDFENRQSIIRHLIIKTVRENTMYSTKVASDAENTEASADESTPSEDKIFAKKEIDKSIDALVLE